eukprot:GHVP01001800.1.p1 GENE.GHVP01001800.1~~GHVP01001800.1.p1  ORF type:complete len:248 (-),score=25.59 GHVP01001800.1:113-856(-)
MEFKLLSDQLKFACEEFSGIPPANGFPDLHQGNLEPEFLGIRHYKREYDYGSHPNVVNRTNVLFERLTKIWNEIEEGEQSFEMELLDGKFSESLNQGSETVFCILEPEKYDRRQHWTIRICNCKKQDDFIHKNREYLKTIPNCKSPDCAKIHITHQMHNGGAAADLSWWFEIFSNYQNGLKQPENKRERYNYVFRSTGPWTRIYHCSNPRQLAERSGKESSEESSEESSDSPVEEQSFLTKLLAFFV